MNKRILGCTALLALSLFQAAPAVSHGEDALFQPFSITGRENTNGVEFGSDAQLGASGSTPGFIINRDLNGRVQTFHAAPDEHSHMGSWGWLGLLGLLGLLGTRSTIKDKHRYT